MSYADSALNKACLNNIMFSGVADPEASGLYVYVDFGCVPTELKGVFHSLIETYPPGTSNETHLGSSLHKVFGPH